MRIHPLAGKPAPPDLLIDVEKVVLAYERRKPDLGDSNQLVSFGTSGHRGSPLDGSFTESHILAMTQAICDYRRTHGIHGPMFMGKDTHAVSRPAERNALEVLAANKVETFIQHEDDVTPTPAISRAILAHNRDHPAQQGDGIVVTPSHNPPSDGGFKYNPPNGGPADTDVTRWIQDRANTLLRDSQKAIQRIPFASALRASTTHQVDFVGPYVDDLASVLDVDVMRSARLTIGIDPLGGAAAGYWVPIRERYGLNMAVVNAAIDPTFRFVTVDHDGKIRMDCSSSYAMASLVNLKDQFDIAFGNDADADRHGIVTRSMGLMNPNQYLAVAIRYLLTHRPQWPHTAWVGKTVVSSSLIDRVVHGLGREFREVPVGFKWFAQGLLNATCCFGGEESAGASFLRHDGTVWTTDKDGLLLGLLAVEITARTGKDPGEHLRELEAQYGTPYYVRIDAPATPEEKKGLAMLSAESVTPSSLAGFPIVSRITHVGDTPIGGLKVITAKGWFAARPSGTENIYKLYAESFESRAHLDAIVSDAQQIVSRALQKGEAVAGR